MSYAKAQVADRSAENLRKVGVRIAATGGGRVGGWRAEACGGVRWLAHKLGRGSSGWTEPGGITYRSAILGLEARRRRSHF